MELNTTAALYELKLIEPDQIQHFKTNISNNYLKWKFYLIVCWSITLLRIKLATFHQSSCLVEIIRGQGQEVYAGQPAPAKQRGQHKIER